MTKELESFSFPDFTKSSVMVDSESPIYPSLLSQMKVDLAVSPESDVWMVYEKPLPEVMKWIEYDIDLATLTLVSLSGKIQDFGKKVPTSMQKYMSRATQVYAVHQGDIQIEDMSVVPLVVRSSLNKKPEQKEE